MEIKMGKEYHVTYSFDNETDGAKAAISRVQRMMKESGSEFISKNDDYDGFTDIVFHHLSMSTEISNLVNKVLESFKNSTAHFSASVCEHNPKVLLDIKDVKDMTAFTDFVNTIARQNNSTSSTLAETEDNMFKVTFTTSKDRQSFQNEYTAKADKFMKNGQDSVNIFPDWDDITILQKNNYSDTKKNHNKFGY